MKTHILKISLLISFFLPIACQDKAAESIEIKRDPLSTSKIKVESESKVGSTPQIESEPTKTQHTYTPLDIPEEENVFRLGEIDQLKNYKGLFVGIKKLDESEPVLLIDESGTENLIINKGAIVQKDNVICSSEIPCENDPDFLNANDIMLFRLKETNSDLFTVQVLFRGKKYKLELPTCDKEDECAVYSLNNTEDAVFVSSNFTSSFIFNALDFQLIPERKIDLPEIPNEVISSDRIYHRENYLKMYGNYLAMKYGSSEYANEMKIYDDPVKKSNVIIMKAPHKYKFSDGRECSLGRYKSDYSNKLYFHNPKTKQSEYCHFDVHDHIAIYNKGSTDEPNEFQYIRIYGFTENFQFAKIKLNNNFYFINVNHCFTKQDECELIDIYRTGYEIDKENLEVVKRNKSHPALNYLITNMKPCVEKKDVECIKKYFLKNEEIIKVDEQACWDTSVAFTEYEFTTSDIEVLKECLSYDNLLTNQLATKAKGKYCVFNHSYMMEKPQIKLLGIYEDPKEIRWNYSSFSRDDKLELLPFNGNVYSENINSRF